MEETEDELPPLPPKAKAPKRGSSNSENKAPKKALKKSKEDGSVEPETRATRKMMRRTGSYLPQAEDTASDDSLSLKRRSGEDSEDLESSVGGKKKKKRLLSSNTSGFFSHMKD